MDAKDILGLRGAPPAAPSGRKAKEPSAAKPKGVSREARGACNNEAMRTLQTMQPRLSVGPVTVRQEKYWHSCAARVCAGVANHARL